MKPSNVLVQLDGRVKVTDFGIAKAADQTNDELTRAGNVMGTARYLAPEQLEGQLVDERADVYSLGLVMYEMVAGRSPFGADTELATAVARLTAPPPRVQAVRPDLAPGLAHVIDRALERNPDDRWPNAATMRDALAPFRVAAPDRTADATMPVAMPPRPRTPAPTTASPIIIDDGMGVGARIAVWILALALGFGAGYAGYVLVTDSGGSGSTPPPATSATQRIGITGAAAFDPVGGDGEHDAVVGRAIDGDRATFWDTESYKQADVGGKPGVGLVLTLAGAAEVRAVELGSPDTGLDVEIYVADTAPATLAGWGEPAATATDLAALDPDPARRPAHRPVRPRLAHQAAPEPDRRHRRPAAVHRADRRGLGPWRPALRTATTSRCAAPRAAVTAVRSMPCSRAISTACTRSAGGSAAPTTRSTPPRTP